MNALKEFIQNFYFIKEMKENVILKKKNVKDYKFLPPRTKKKIFLRKLFNLKLK